MKSLLHWAAAMLCVIAGLNLKANAQYVIDSLDGEVTQHEADVFVNTASATPIPISHWAVGTPSHNQLAYFAGSALEAINDMYVVTGELGMSAEHAQLLNLAIKWSDAWLIHRNDLPLGEHRVMWTGDVDPIWPPNPPTHPHAKYVGSETGDTVGHLAYTLLNIVRTPAIWNKTVPDGDPNHFGVTYRERAKTYETMLEFSMSNYFNKYFIDPKTLLLRPPSSPAWKALEENVDAWNRQMMFLNAYQRLSQVHALLGDNPELAKRYAAIVRNSVNAFVHSALERTAPDGHPVYIWGYGNMGDVVGELTGETTGHGQYDIWGLVRAYHDGFTDATPAQMQRYADTVVHEISGGTNKYFSTIDRSDGKTDSFLTYAWIFLSPYNAAIFKPAANAAIAAGEQQRLAIMTSTILWTKHELARQGVTAAIQRQ